MGHKEDKDEFAQLDDFAMNFVRNDDSVKDTMSPLALLEQRVRNKERLSESDIVHINEQFMEQHAKIMDGRDADMMTLVGMEYQAQQAYVLREQEHFDMDTHDLPYYLESEIGTNETPAELEQVLNEKRQEFEDAFEANKLDLFEEMYAVEHYDFSNASVRTLGMTAVANGCTPKVLRSDVKNIEGYAAFCDKKFDDRLVELKEAHCSDKLKQSEVSVDKARAMDAAVFENMSHKSDFLPDF